MKHSISFIIAITFLLYSCNANNQNLHSAKNMKDYITKLDDSIQSNFESMMFHQELLNKDLLQRAANANIQFYHKYPNDSFAANALQKAASLFFQLKDEAKAAKWRDTLLIHYPDISNRAGLLELQMNYYDLNQYDPKKITYYGTLLLEEKDLSSQKRKSILFRLKNVDKTFEEMILLQQNKK